MFWQSENGYWLTNADYPNEGQWLDDSVWSIYHGIADANQTSVLLKRMDSNTSFYEGVPARWTDFVNAHWHCSWFGRLGAGDIMARYKIGDPKGAYRNLEKISSIIAAQGDIYEGYDMDGCGLAKCVMHNFGIRIP